MRNLIAIVLLALLLLPAQAQNAQFFVNETDRFMASIAKSKSFESLYPKLSASTVKTLKGMSPEERARAFKMMQFGAAMSMGTPMKVKESKIGSNQATITMASDKSTEKTKGGGTVTTSASMTMNFLKEGGRWRVDLSEQLASMK